MGPDQISAVALPVRPFQIGDRVVVWGRIGTVSALARSLSNEQTIVTVAFGGRVSLRVRASDIQPFPS